MKNSIFTIGLLFATGVVFAQEIPTAEILKTRTKSNQCNERVSSTIDSTSLDGAKKEYVGHVTINRRDTMPNGSQSSSEATITTVPVTEKKHTKTGHVTLLK